MNHKVLIKSLLVAKAALGNDKKFVERRGSSDDVNLNFDALYHVDHCLKKLDVPECPNCKSHDRVVVSPKPELGEFFCPCNEPGPQYFNRDGTGTFVGAGIEGRVTSTRIQ